MALRRAVQPASALQTVRARQSLVLTAARGTAAASRRQVRVVTLFTLVFVLRVCLCACVLPV